MGNNWDNLNPSSEVKEAINQFNNDFNDRCMQDDIIRNNHNQITNWINEHIDPKSPRPSNLSSGIYRSKRGYNEMNLNEENKKILRDVKEDVIRFGMANMYNFGESEDIMENHKKSIDQMIMSHSKDQTITPSINHTGFPDDIVIVLIELNTGYKVRSIEDFSSIKAVWHNDKYKIGYIFDLELSCSSISVNVDISGEVSDK